MATWKDHIDNLTCETVKSANKALDYYDGWQLPWLKALLDCPKQGITKWEERGVYPWFTNLTKKIVDRSALSYNKAPKRIVNVNDTVSDEGTETYSAILEAGEFEAVMDSADSVSRLLKTVIILAQAVEPVNGEEKVMFSVLHQGNCDVDYDFKNQTIRSLCYMSAGCGVKGGKLYHFWNDQETYDIEVDENGQMKASPPEPHDYGMIPAAILWDTFKPRAGFWPKPAWEEVITLNEGVNLFHTEVKFNERFQAFGALFSNADIPEGSVIGPDSVVDNLGQTSDGSAVFLEYRTPDINLEKFADWLKDFESDIADNWGVNLRVSGGGSADSGFKLVVEEIWNLQTRNDRIKSAKQYERDMYTVILAISEARSLGLPAKSKIAVEFPPPSLPVNEKEAHDINVAELGIGLTSKEDIWLKENPDLTPEEIEAKKLRIAAEKAPIGPGFANVNDDGEQ